MHPVYKKYIKKSKKYSVHDKTINLKMVKQLVFKKIDLFQKQKNG